MNEKLLTININIADRSYPILINRKEEEHIRKAVKFVNELILEFKRKYPTSAESKISTIDYLAMASVQSALKLMQVEELKDTEALMKKVEEINQDIHHFLAE